MHSLAVAERVLMMRVRNAILRDQISVQTEKVSELRCSGCHATETSDAPFHTSA